MSCTYRLEKAIQRLEGVDKVKVQIQPPRADVTPKAGAWLDAAGLRKAVKNAGFKPGEVRYTLTGTLTTWQGQPALRLPTNDRLLVLQAAPEATDAFERARHALPEAEGKRVEAEVVPVDPGNPRGKHVPSEAEGSTPATVRLHRLVISAE